MPTLADYYRDLLIWEGVESRSLVDTWPEALIVEVKNDFIQSVARAQLKGSQCPLRDRSSNQSIGNQVEAFVVPQLTQNLSRHAISSCSGAGYPDQVLSSASIRMPLEIKATGDWNPRDSNRRVLTSSSTKLRDQFQSPIYHLLCTVLYSVQANGVRIDALRLDFLEPSTAVSVRLEASVSHKLLSQAPHQSVVI